MGEVKKNFRREISSLHAAPLRFLPDAIPLEMQLFRSAGIKSAAGRVRLTL
jgi:hypothetical protein